MAEVVAEELIGDLQQRAEVIREDAAVAHLIRDGALTVATLGAYKYLSKTYQGTITHINLLTILLGINRLEFKARKENIGWNARKIL